MDNNQDENLIRPHRFWVPPQLALLLLNRLASGPPPSCELDPVGSASTGLDPTPISKDVLDRLPTQRDSEIEDLLPHNWKPKPTVGLSPPVAG